MAAACGRLRWRDANWTVSDHPFSSLFLSRSSLPSLPASPFCLLLAFLFSFSVHHVGLGLRDQSSRPSRCLLFAFSLFLAPPTALHGTLRVVARHLHGRTRGMKHGGHGPA